MSYLETTLYVSVKFPRQPANSNLVLGSGLQVVEMERKTITFSESALHWHAETNCKRFTSRAEQFNKHWHQKNNYASSPVFLLVVPSILSVSRVGPECWNSTVTEANGCPVCDRHCLESSFAPCQLCICKFVLQSFSTFSGFPYVTLESSSDCSDSSPSP